MEWTFQQLLCECKVLSLKWEPHINNITSKANVTGDLEKKSENNMINNHKRSAYKTLVRPHLETNQFLPSVYLWLE